mgnify:CR=1 FL=1
MCFQDLLRRLRAIANRAGDGVSIADLAVAWVLSRPGVGAAIVGARGVGRIDATSASARRHVSAVLLDACTAAADAALRPVRGEVYELERNLEGKHGRIMRYNLQAMSGEPYVVELEERRAAADEALRKQADGAGFVETHVAKRRYRKQVAAVADEARALASGVGSSEDVRGRAKRLMVLPLK